MNDIYRKVSRGQVWFLIDDHLPAVHYDGSVQGKNRPWLIVSNNMCNQSSPIYTIVPLTTAPKNLMPTHVEITADNITQTVLCEQIRTVSQNVFNASGSHYKYTLSENVMKRVDEALAVQLGLQIVFPNSDRYWESLSRLIRVKVKEAVDSMRVNTIDIGKVASLLDARVDSIVNKTVNSPPVVEDSLVETKADTVTEPEPVVETEGTSEPIEEPKRDLVPIKKSKPRNKWTKESMQTFLDDFDKYATDIMLKKYGMTLKTLYVTRSKFKKLVQEQ